jgi:Undecaprenyl-phosphate galactose phosphotransferase WbaP
MISIMLCIGAGFFLQKILYLTNIIHHGINFKSFVTYWPYLPAFITVFAINNLYPAASLAPAEELRLVSYSSLIVHTAIVLSRFIYYLGFDTVSAALAISFLCSLVGILAVRSVMRSFLRLSGLGGIPAVIYGAGYTGQAVADKLLANKKSGYVPVLMLDDDKRKGGEYRGIPIINDTSLGPEIVRRFNIKMAVVAMPSLSHRELKKLITGSVSAFRYTIRVPDIYSINDIWTSVRDFGGILGFATANRLNMFWNLWIKRLMDVFIVLAGSLVLSPVLLLTAIAIKLSSPGPVLYSQRRIGQNGKHFNAYKFRSMVADADKKLKELLDTDKNARKEWDQNQKLKNDPRITGIGRFIRKTSIDEFPQFINVLKGEMSLIGPRPIVDNEIEKYGSDFQRIFSIKPGLTGLWQVSGRSDTNYTDRVSYDTYYLQSWSVWLDIWIIFKTFGVILWGRGAY